MSSDSLNAIQQLPYPIPANGLFNVLQNIADGSFNDPLNRNSTYASYVLDPAKLIGTDNAPFVPIAIPAYITTLYQNVYNLNNSLTNNMQGSTTDDRVFPTAFAVQKYVQSQIAGVQIITDASGSWDTVTTTENNTVITGVSLAVQSLWEYAVDITAGKFPVAIYNMDNGLNSARNGSSKLVVFGDSNYLTDATGTTQTGNQAFLYAGNNGYFLVAGKQQKYYQFTFFGDSLSFTQLYNSNNQWIWIVNDYSSIFSTTVNLPNFQANA